MGVASVSEVEKVVPIRVASLGDLVRLAVSTMIPQQFSTYIIRFRHRDKVYLGILGVFRDYYKYYGIPVFYYYSTSPESVGDANYIIVSTGEEKIELSKNPKPGVAIPIVSIAEKPVFIPDDI